MDKLQNLTSIEIKLENNSKDNPEEFQTVISKSLQKKINPNPSPSSSPDNSFEFSSNSYHSNKNENNSKTKPIPKKPSNNVAA